MTRFATLAALAIATATGSAAFAATDAQIAEIESFGNADASGLTDGQVANVLNAIHSGGTMSEKQSLVDSLLRQYR